MVNDTGYRENSEFNQCCHNLATYDDGRDQDFDERPRGSQTLGDGEGETGGRLRIGLPCQGSMEMQRHSG